MTKDLKDTAEIIIMNGAAVGFSITDCNEILTFISLILAITISCYKLTLWIMKKK
jgi:uncharacterized membrane protein